MRTPDYLPPRGSTAVFSGPWLRYQPAPGVDRYVLGYVAVVLGWWNGAVELSVDGAALHAIAASFDGMAEYVGGDWRSVDLDDGVLTVSRPLSLGGGVHRVEAVDGRYRIGWGLPWLAVDPRRCDIVVGGT
ncbi:MULTISPECIES: hypothetical protein [unclassified Micromonospora]|uniref:hypothetical protein n=1 Tax=unclassified Micromonospora TaxID=2617518 RepID=UPI001C247EA5|nr:MULTISPECIES: hypothetical protein [unclassified Micromonospora]MBU8857760.1 hypothetical protein [Micromonospora sp. WMMB482]MDM4783387.1 hypothetical protein [Micromonospora sp. b486]